MSDDQLLECRDCHDQFEFSAGEADFFKQQGFNPPVRCKACRQRKKAEKAAKDANGY